MDRYKIVAAYHIEDLEAKVNSYIKEGYLPLGRAVIGEGYGKYLQTMFKLEVYNGNQ